MLFMATLLIAEDDPKTNEAICEYMKSAVQKAISAYDGAQALRCFQEEKPDLVALDIMPLK
jgi:DNA-binding response OmpR family regulator